MSTFSGFVSEFPGISIDCFLEENQRQSKVFFLSHVHSDHMKGMSSWEFQEKLSEDGIFLYSSAASTKMLQLWFPTCAEKFVDLPIQKPTLLEIPDTKEFISVTLIPAGHCPGSVMILLEGKNKIVLYTGDFRLNVQDLAAYKCFYDSAGHFKRIDKVYLDTTFFNRLYPEFPTREESFDGLCTLITEFIEQDPKNTVNIETSAVYGSEFVFVELWKYFSMPIHVSQRCYEVYKYFPEMDKAITLDKHATRLHSCDWADIGRGSFCQKFDWPQEYIDAHFMLIKLSAYVWKNWRRNKSEVVEKGWRPHFSRFFRVCYSSHPSMQETIDFIEFLKPSDIEANVVPENEVAASELKALMATLMLNPKKKSVDVEESEKVKLFQVKRCKMDKSDESDENGEEDLFSLLDSPKK